MYSHSVLMGWVSKLLLSHQRKRKKLRCSCLTLTWWNISWMSHMTATCSWRNLHSTPTRSLVRSGPWRRCRLRHSPANSTLQSQTIFIFSGFLVWHTPRWGIYHTWPFFSEISSAGTFLHDFDWWCHSWMRGNHLSTCYQPSVYSSTSWDVSRLLICCWAL